VTATAQHRDARSTTWQFVAPADAAELLVLADADDSPAGATAITGDELPWHLRPEGWAAVAAPDLGAVTANSSRHETLALLDLLAEQVAPRGWLLVGVANTRYPGGRTGGGALSLGQLRRAVHRAGLHLETLYLALPDHRHPAALAAARPAAALDQLLLRLPTTYVGSASRWARTRRGLRTMMAWAAGAAPHPLRVWLAPGYILIARRPR
jgi:hypothetical protein